MNSKPLIYAQQQLAIGTRIDLTEELQLNHNSNDQFAQIFIPDYFERIDAIILADGLHCDLDIPQ